MRRRLLITALVVVALALAGLGACFDAAALIRASFRRTALRLDPLG